MSEVGQGARDPRKRGCAVDAIDRGRFRSLGTNEASRVEVVSGKQEKVSEVRSWTF